MALIKTRQHNVFQVFLISLVIIPVLIVTAVDVDGYTSNTACAGAGRSCTDIRINVCCEFAGLLPRAVRIGYLDHCQFGVVFRGNSLKACDISIASQYGPGRKCFLGHGSIYGGSWYSVYPCGSVENEVLSDELQLTYKCNDTVLPNAIFYTATTDSSQGKWVLDADAEQHDTLLSQLGKVADHEKVNWLEAQGAYYVTDRDQPVVAETKVYWQ